MTWHENLTEKQRRFVEVFSSNGGNALDAARVAGYRQPHPQGAENMQKPTVRAAIEALREETTTNSILTREARQKYWSRIIRGEEVEADGKPAAIRDRLRASELLARSQGDFLDRAEVDTGPNLAEILNARLRRIDGPRAEAVATA